MSCIILWRWEKLSIWEKQKSFSLCRDETKKPVFKRGFFYFCLREHDEIKVKQIKTSTGLEYLGGENEKLFFFIDKQCEWKMSTLFELFKTSSIYNCGEAKKMHLNVDAGSVLISAVCEDSA